MYHYSIRCSFRIVSAFSFPLSRMGSRHSLPPPVPAKNCLVIDIIRYLYANTSSIVIYIISTPIQISSILICSR
jgi:hypothetical protein